VPRQDLDQAVGLLAAQELHPAARFVQHLVRCWFGMCGSGRFGRE